MKAHWTACVILAAAIAGCSKQSGDAAPASSGSATTTSTAATAAGQPKPATAPAGAAPTGTGKAAVNGLPITATLKTGTVQMPSYTMVVTVTNKGAKEITTLGTAGCVYDKGGDKTAGETDNGVDVSIKPGASADVTISADLTSVGPGFTGVAAFSGIKYADGSYEKATTEELSPCSSWLSHVK